MMARRNMKVAMTTDAVGGVWRYCVDCAGELARHGVSVTLVGFGPAPSGAHRAEAQAAGIPLVWLDGRLDWTVADEDAARELGAVLDGFIAEFRPDILHLNSPALGSFLSAPLRRVTAAHSCLATWWQAMRGEGPPPQWRWHHRLMRRGLAGADIAIAPSESFAADLRRAYGPLPALRVVHNASRPVLAARKEAFVLSAGRWWDEAKNFSTLSAAAPDIVWPVHAAGSLRGPDGGGREPEGIVWLGELPHEELRGRIARAPVFVSLSRYEPFGLSVLEAASAGAALVLSDIPTFRELWDPCALFVDASDPAAVAAAANRLIEDASLRVRLSAAAASRARSYSLEQQAEGLLAAYLAAAQDQALAV